MLSLTEASLDFMKKGAGKYFENQQGEHDMQCIICTSWDLWMESKLSAGLTTTLK